MLRLKSPNILDGLLDLVYPELCPFCRCEQPIDGHHLCLNCLADLPLTNHHRNPLENELASTFWGRLPVAAAAALLFFSPGGKTQNLIGRIKYEGRKDLGVEIGKAMGHFLKKSEHFNRVDLILPVPLHPGKKAKRGFNQCDLLARGMSEVMDIPWSANTVSRIRNNPSQTRLGRDRRFDNSQSLFKVTKPENTEGKNILLVDDVITTGATLESCGREILDSGAKNLYITTLGCGEFT